MRRCSLRLILFAGAQDRSSAWRSAPSFIPCKHFSATAGAVQIQSSWGSTGCSSRRWAVGGSAEAPDGRRTQNKPERRWPADSLQFPVPLIEQRCKHTPLLSCSAMSARPCRLLLCRRCARRLCRCPSAVRPRRRSTIWCAAAGGGAHQSGASTRRTLREERRTVLTANGHSTSALLTANRVACFPPHPPSITLQVDIVTAAGIPVVCSAGNQAAEACNQSPASAATSIAVGSMRMDDARSMFSSALRAR